MALRCAYGWTIWRALPSFAKLCPEADATLESQQRRGVEVRLWRKEFPEDQPADVEFLDDPYARSI